MSDTITFRVKKIIWENEDGKKSGKKATKWKLMLCEAPLDKSWPKPFWDEAPMGKIISFTMTGEMQSPEYDSQKFEATGKWHFDKKKNQYTFAAEFISASFPNTREDCVEFIRHCGARISARVANLIIDKFGCDLNYIAQCPDEVAASIKGISFKSACKLSNKVDLMAVTSNLITLLKPLGVDFSDITKIAREYGPEASDIISANPYQMWHLVGFYTCDKIALAKGFDVGNSARLSCAVMYEYNILKNKTGAIMAYRPNLEAATLNLLNSNYDNGAVPPDVVTAHIDKMLANHTCVHNTISLPDGTKKEFFYSKDDFVSERDLARNIFRISSIEISKNDKSAQDFLSFLEDWKEQGVTLSGRQKEAVANVAQNTISVITGGPGTGKTTCLKAIVDCYHQAYPDSPIVLMAPTGLAAKRMSDATNQRALSVHKSLGLVPSAKSVGGFSQETDPEDLSGLIIVDESSMLGIHITGFLMKSVVYTNATRIVFVGDIDQLPPVNQGAFFEDIINCKLLPVTRLDRNFRQEAGNTIIDAAYAINAGDFASLKYTNDFVFVPIAENEIAEEIKKQFLEESKKYGLKQTFVLSPTRRSGVLCTNELNKVLQNLVNPAAPDKVFMKRGSTIFRQDDRVICLKNDPDLDIVNGDIGYVQNIARGESGDTELIVQFETHKVSFTPDKLENLELAYAITVHKSQGCEFDCVIMPASFTQKVMLYRNLLYTGVTRAKKKVILIGQEGAIKTAVSTLPPKTDKSLLCLRLRKLFSQVQS